MKCFLTIFRHDELTQCLAAIKAVKGKPLSVTWSELAGVSLSWIFTGGWVVVYEATEEAEWLRKT